MDEAKVRKAFQVANELAETSPEEYRRDAFVAIFHAMLDADQIEAEEKGENQ